MRSVSGVVPADIQSLSDAREAGDTAVFVEESLSNALGKNVDVVQIENVKKDGSRSNRRFYSHLERDKVLIYEKA